MRKFIKHRYDLILIPVVLILAACSSRYRLDLFVVQGEERTKIKVEKTEFLRDAVLADPTARVKWVPGDGNCLTLITGSRGRTLEAEAQDLISYDRYTRYRVFLQLPSHLQAGTINLVDNSFVQLMGRYEIVAEDKMYFPTGGTLAVDSIPGKHLFGTIEGQYENRNGDAVAFSGQFKVKVSR